MERKKESVLYDTDVVARNIWHTLVRDFRTSEGLSFCCKAEDAFLTNGVTGLREYSYPELGYIPIGRFKRYRQMQELLKKYRFAADKYTDEELRKITLDKYFSEQERLAAKRPLSPLAVKVTQRARKIAREILGPLDRESLVNNCRFGSRSSIGCPLSRAYLDVKLSDRRAFTGSSENITWFNDNILQQDAVMRQIVGGICVNSQEKPEDVAVVCENLTLVTVPKSWKTYRVITPMALLDLFYSNGVGKVIQDKLADAGLDISRLQSRHQRLVKDFSVTRKCATADLSAASDSLTRELLNRVLPREWYCILKPILKNQIVYTSGDRDIEAYTESVLPMGNGATFPVETLVFYCLIKAIGELSGTRGIFSVYGDDLIYPSRLHKFVSVIFPILGLKLNLDKTFVRAPFRESCGSDFYRGGDVRPFYLQGERQLLTRLRYQAFLYKTYNGLTRRWDPLEIPSTLRFIILELLRVSDEILRIPPGFPDTAGIKVEEPSCCPLGLTPMLFSPIWLCLDQWGNSYWGFRHLVETPKHRFCVSPLPYYWRALQGVPGQNSNPDSNVRSGVHAYSIAQHQELSWLKIVRYHYKTTKKGRLKQADVQYLPATTSRQGARLVAKYGTCSDWY